MNPMKKFSWKNTPTPFVCLAPMAGYTDSPYRQIVKAITPEVICFSELTSINAIEQGSQKTEKMLEFQKIERPIIIQLFGKDPEFFAKAGKKLEAAGVDGIDINMGCPAKKVVCSEYGSALLNNPKLAGEIVKALSKAVKIPVSVKMRISYSKYDEAKFLEFIKTLEKAGCSALTIHGRTTKQGYQGEADWAPIYLAKKTLKIPVIGNGDLDSVEKARERLTSPDGKITLDGLMIGRATAGNPWILREIAQSLQKNTQTSTTKTTSSPKSIKQKLPTIKKHLRLAVKQYGERTAAMEMKKHLSGYVAGFPGAKELRMSIMLAKSTKEILELLNVDANFRP